MRTTQLPWRFLHSKFPPKVGNSLVEKTNAIWGIGEIKGIREIPKKACHLDDPTPKERAHII